MTASESALSVISNPSDQQECAMLVRRLSTVAAATVAVIALTASSASAHFCYFSDPNPNGDAGRAGSDGFRTFESIATEFTGLCPAGIEVLADAAGISTDTLINAHGVMAGPTDGNDAISHLDFAALDAALGTPEAPGPAVLACL
jgi:hypothetical protein